MPMISWGFSKNQPLCNFPWYFVWFVPLPLPEALWKSTVHACADPVSLHRQFGAKKFSSLSFVRCNYLQKIRYRYRYVKLGFREFLWFQEKPWNYISGLWLDQLGAWQPFFFGLGCLSCETFSNASLGLSSMVCFIYIYMDVVFQAGITSQHPCWVGTSWCHLQFFDASYGNKQPSNAPTSWWSFAACAIFVLSLRSKRYNMVPRQRFAKGRDGICMQGL